MLLRYDHQYYVYEQLDMTFGVSVNTDAAKNTGEIGTVCGADYLSVSVFDDTNTASFKSS